MLQQAIWDPSLIPSLLQVCVCVCVCECVHVCVCVWAGGEGGGGVVGGGGLPKVGVHGPERVRTLAQGGRDRLLRGV